MRKRSIALRGHSTSVSLEDAFWAELKRMAAGRRMPLSALVAEIDGSRTDSNLSSALRLAVLADLKGAIGSQAHQRAG